LGRRERSRLIQKMDGVKWVSGNNAITRWGAIDVEFAFDVMKKRSDNQGFSGV
jgi:hypothetical protein